MANFIDLTGQRFGRLVVKSYSHKYDRYSYWLCVCDCGKTAVVRGANLKSGKTRSCGCLHDELSAQRIAAQNLTHGESKSRLYGIWSDMKRRCLNCKRNAFERYGGRGIAVDPDWMSYDAFAVWAYQSGYSETLSLDRVDNDGPYSPQNCRWATKKKQANNKSNNVTFECGKERLTLAQWAERKNISYTTLYGRVFRLGWPIERALTEPVRRCKPRDRKST